MEQAECSGKVKFFFPFTPVQCLQLCLCRCLVAHSHLKSSELLCLSLGSMASTFPILTHTSKHAFPDAKSKVFKF
jgi:hypothetical protein